MGNRVEVRRRFRGHHQKKKAAQDKADAAAAKLAKINQDLVAANKEKNSLQFSLRNQQSGPNPMVAVDAKIAGLQHDQAAAQKDYNDKLADIPRPDFPKTIPLPGTETAVASNAPTGNTTTSNVATNVPSAVPRAVTTINPTAPDQPVPPTPDPANEPPAVVVKTNTPPAPPPSAPAKEHHTTRYAAAFGVAPNLAVTSAETISGATALELQTSDGGTIKAEVVRTDDATGLALLKFSANVPVLPIADTASSGALQCIGYPDVDLFNPTAQAIQGTTVAPAQNWKVKLEISPRLPAPLMQKGMVIGVEFADRDSDPAHIPAVTLDKLKEFLKDDARAGAAVTDPATAMMQVVATK